MSLLFSMTFRVMMSSYTVCIHTECMHIRVSRRRKRRKGIGKKEVIRHAEFDSQLASKIDNKESKSDVGRKPPTDMAISGYQHTKYLFISNSRSTLTFNSLELYSYVFTNYSSQHYYAFSKISIQYFSPTTHTVYIFTSFILFQHQVQLVAIQIKFEEQQLQQHLQQQTKHKRPPIVPPRQ